MRFTVSNIVGSMPFLAPKCLNRDLTLRIVPWVHWFLIPSVEAVLAPEEILIGTIKNLDRKDVRFLPRLKQMMESQFIMRTSYLLKSHKRIFAIT